MSLTEERIEKNKKDFLQALRLHMGNVSKAMECVGIKSRTTHYTWMQEDADYKAEVDAINEANIDLAEGELLKNIKSGDTTSLIFFLKTKGKSRGYVEKIEHEQKIDAKTEVTGKSIEVTHLPDKLIFDVVDAINKEEEDADIA